MQARHRESEGAELLVETTHQQARSVIDPEGWNGGRIPWHLTIVHSWLYSMLCKCPTRKRARRPRAPNLTASTAVSSRSGATSACRARSPTLLETDPGSPSWSL